MTTRSYISAMAREARTWRGISGTCSLAAMFLAIVAAVEIAGGAL